MQAVLFCVPLNVTPREVHCLEKKVNAVWLATLHRFDCLGIRNVGSCQIETSGPDRDLFTQNVIIGGRYAWSGPSGYEDRMASGNMRN